MCHRRCCASRDSVEVGTAHPRRRTWPRRRGASRAGRERACRGERGRCGVAQIAATQIGHGVSTRAMSIVAAAARAARTSHAHAEGAARVLVGEGCDCVRIWGLGFVSQEPEGEDWMKINRCEVGGRTKNRWGEIPSIGGSCPRVLTTNSPSRGRDLLVSCQIFSLLLSHKKERVEKPAAKVNLCTWHAPRLL